MKKNIFIAVVVSIILIITLLPACSFAGGAVEPLEQVERPTWQVGDTWIYQVSRGGRSPKKQIRTVVKVTDEGYVVAIYASTNGKKTYEFYNRDLHSLKIEDETGTIIAGYGKGIPAFKWPTRLGESWSGQYMGNDNKGWGGLSYLNVEVASAETLIGVDGKEIATLKFIYKRKNLRETSASECTYWYSPEVGYLVKRQINYHYNSKEAEEWNLLSFTPGAR